MRPFAASDGHDVPRLIDEFVPSLAAMVDDVIWDVNTRLESQLSRMNCQMFSTGFNSGHLGGNGMMVMLAGTSSFAVVCQPA